MSHSKLLPLDLILKLGQGYIDLLEKRPVLIKSITSGLIGALGNFVAQKVGQIADADLNVRSIFAFGIFGLGLGGPLVHYFLNWLAHHGPANPILKVILDRFGFGPCYLLLLFYVLPRLEGCSHSDAVDQIKRLYWSALKMSWKVWIPVQLINLNLVPLQYRVLVTNLVSVGWNIYLSQRRAKQQKEQEATKDE